MNALEAFISFILAAGCIVLVTVFGVAILLFLSSY